MTANRSLWGETVTADTPLVSYCGSWFGADVVALVCDRDQIVKSLREYTLDEPGSLVLVSSTTGAVGRDAPGITQVLGRDLKPGDQMTFVGSATSPTGIAVRTSQGNTRVETRFDNLGLTDGGELQLTVSEGVSSPLITLKRENGEEILPALISTVPRGG
jgi:hypothetical protein